MSFRSIATGLITISFAGALLYVGCGGGDSSPTRPAEPTTPTPPPTPPPAPTVSRVEVSPNTVSLEVGKTQQFTATAKASDGAVVSGVNFTWSSSNTAVATISAGGRATAVSVGTATIRATGNGILSEPATVTVTQAPVSRVTIAPSAAQDIMVGEMVTFTATARTAGGTARDDVSISWASSDTSVVTITSAGVATAVGAGSAMVRATAAGITSSPVTINVSEPPPPEPVVATVTVSPAEAMIEVGATQQFTAVATTADGMVIDNVEFTWMTDDTEVAMVDDTGLVTAVAAGTAMITATGNDVTSMPATVTVEELAPEVSSVEIVDAMPLMLVVGETHQLMAVARTSDGTMVGGAAFVWSSEDSEVATVDSTGLVTAVGAGMTDVTAMIDGATSEPVTVTVAEPPPVVDRVTVEPMTASIEEGEIRRFSATAYTSDNEEISGKTFTWTSSDETVATISATGLARGVDAGSTTITATADGVSGTASLTVTEPPPPPEPMVATVTVSPPSASIEEDETRQFSATARESDGTVISGKTFTWTSSVTSVATVSPSSGTATTATGVDAGSTTIRATVDGISGTASLTVTEPPPPPPPMLRSRTATISGSYSAAGAVTLSEVAGGQLKLTITGLNSTAPDTWLALSENATIHWAKSETLPSTARSFGEVSDGNFANTFTPPSGKDIDSYDYVILYCRDFDLLISSNLLSN